MQVQVHCADGTVFSRLWRHDGLLSALAVAERVRWQLDGRAAGQSQDQGQGPGRAGGDSWPGTSGITLLRLIPDQLVRATGRQLALWGDSVISDRVARAAIRVQAMLGHEAVTRPVLAGGRSPAEQAGLVPFGDTGTPQRPSDRPWPGQIPAPAPAAVFAVPLAASVTDSAGLPVAVSGRAELSAPPAWLSAAGGPPSGNHRLGRSVAGHRTVVGSAAGTPAGQVPASDRRWRRLAGSPAGRPLADRGQLRLTAAGNAGVARPRLSRGRAHLISQLFTCALAWAEVQDDYLVGAGATAAVGARRLTRSRTGLSWVGQPTKCCELYSNHSDAVVTGITGRLLAT